MRVYCSRSNPGAAAAGRAIQRGLLDLARENTSERWGSPSNRDRGDAETAVEEWKLGLSLTSRQPAWAMPSEATPTRGLPHGSAGTPTHFLLYLNRLTFTGLEGEALADGYGWHGRAYAFDVARERQGERWLRVRPLFGPPKDLISDGLYSALALAFTPSRSARSPSASRRALGAVGVRTVASRSPRSTAAALLTRITTSRADAARRRKQRACRPRRPRGHSNPECSTWEEGAQHPSAI